MGSKLDSRWFWAKCKKAIPKCILGQMSEGNPQVHSGPNVRRQSPSSFWAKCQKAIPKCILLLLIFFWMQFWYVRFVHKYLNFASLSKGLLHVFMYCDFVLHAIHETAIYFPLSQHLLLDQSPYNALMKLMVCMLWPHKLTSSSSIMTCVYRWISTICYLFWLS